MGDVMAFMSQHFYVRISPNLVEWEKKNIVPENAFDILVDKMSDFSLTPPYVKLQ